MRPIITLTNGKRVGNFSSPHPFTFEDGSILPAVSNEDAKRLSVEFIETKIIHPRVEGDIELSFDLNEEVLSEMSLWQKLADEKKVDVVFCPLPMISALNNLFGQWMTLKSPFRAIRMQDRIKKLVSISKQCI